MAGYIGRILNVDLTREKIITETLDDAFYRKWLGGYGGMAGVYKNLFDFLEAVVGWNVTIEEMKAVSDRIATMRQAFNVREGFKPSDFRLPDRILGKPPLKSGPSAGVALDLEPQARERFAKMGWDYETGKPSQEKLVELGLEDIVKDFY